MIARPGAYNHQGEAPPDLREVLLATGLPALSLPATATFAAAEAPEVAVHVASPELFASHTLFALEGTNLRRFVLRNDQAGRINAKLQQAALERERLAKLCHSRAIAGPDSSAAVGHIHDTRS